MIERVCWVVPRDSLRLQAEEAFADPAWRANLGHALRVRAAENQPDPSRGLDEYVTTYQGVAAAADLRLAEFRRHSYLLVVDEVHHLPRWRNSTQGCCPLPRQGGSWTRRPAGRARCCPCSNAPESVCCCRHPGTRGRAWHPLAALPARPAYRHPTGGTSSARLGDGRLFARTGVGRAAVLPVTFGALDGQARWLDEERRAARGLPPGAAAPGLGKLLVVAPDQVNARRYQDRLRRWLPGVQAETTVRLATSDCGDAHKAGATFRLLPDPRSLSPWQWPTKSSTRRKWRSSPR
jgi:hypothetical protein